ncbi:MAG TPA: nuclear transport factor 2 family protein [Pyrinomonadaceae bacterium]|jgi:flagellar hook-associated protein FlgK
MSKILSKGRLSVIMLLAISFAFSAACKKNANTGNTTSNTGTTTTTTTATGGGTTGGAAAGSPTAALRAYYDAAMRKDIPTAKRYLSSGTMRMMEEGARKMGKTVDEAFQEGAQQTPTASMPEFSNEKISGDTATVDLKSQGISLTMPMVKEGGEWKIAMDRMIEDMKNSMGGSTGGGAPTMPEGDGNDNDDHGGHEEK